MALGAASVFLPCTSRLGAGGAFHVDAGSIIGLLRTGRIGAGESGEDYSDNELAVAGTRHTGVAAVHGTGYNGSRFSDTDGHTEGGVGGELGTATANVAGESKLRLQSFGIRDTTTPTEPSAFLMKMLLSLIALSVLTTCTFAQTPMQEAESNWTAKLEALNKEYFEKLKQLQAEQIESLESMRKNATTQDRLDEAIQLRDLIDKMKAEMGEPVLPDDNSKLTRDKARVANILRQSKWNCAENPNLSKWFGKSFVFHENGTIVPSSDISAKLPHHRWAILDSRTIVGMFGDYMIVFRVNEKGNAMDVLENGNCIDTKTKRHGFVVQSPQVTRALRDGK